MVKALLFGLLLGGILDGCTTLAAFTYKHYGLAAVSYDGSLLGPIPSQDISLKLCETTGNEAGKCIVMLAPEFYRLKGDFLVLEKRLIACEQSKR